jgi:formyltetrahydrofolate-dependent phosphoribosylglycinamide formyltransferase
MTCRIGILISGHGTNMEALVDHIREEKADIRVLFVGSDKASAEGLEIARSKGIPAVLLPYREGRAAGEREIERLWQENSIDLLVLAGFMRLITADFVKRHEGRILNIHPALLPKFPGTHGIDDFWKSGEPFSGVTVHVVDEKMDHGPILLQQKVMRETNDTRDTFETKIHAVEHRIYWQALKKYIQDHIA